MRHLTALGDGLKMAMKQINMMKERGLNEFKKGNTLFCIYGH
jgi:hypothetical protein